MALNETNYRELEALILAFLQQSIRKHPHGMSLHTFENEFPNICDEPEDWFKRYRVESALEALIMVPQVAKITNSLEEVNIELNIESKLHDNHLIELFRN